MTAIKNLAGRARGLCTSLLRRVEDFMSSPAMANYTHTGPASLATGQAGNFRFGDRQARIQDTAAIARSPAFDQSPEPGRAYAHPANLRQFLWI